MYTIYNNVAFIHLDEYIKNYRDVDKFIEFCKVCTRYNNCWSCPPYDFDTDNYISGYKNAYIIATKIVLDDELRNTCLESQSQKEEGRRILYEVRNKLDKRLLQLERKYPGSLTFFAGTCHKCPEGECTRIKGNPCLFPEDIRHSLESLGFDIGKTSSELLNIPLKWSMDGKLPEYFTLISGLFTNEEIESLIIPE